MLLTLTTTSMQQEPAARQAGSAHFADSVSVRLSINVHVNHFGIL